MDNAFERARAAYGTGAYDDAALEFLFPQLKESESEDERIRREIIDFIQWAEERGTTRNDYHQAKRPAVWIAYLEKQKEQKPAEWSEEDETIRHGIECLIMFALQDGSSIAPGCATTKEQALNWLKSLRPRQKVEWSEEDSKRYVSIRTTLETSAVLSKEDYDANVVWLRNLVNVIKYSGPKPSWKPSEDEECKNSK